MTTLDSDDQVVILPAVTLPRALHEQLAAEAATAAELVDQVRALAIRVRPLAGLIEEHLSASCPELTARGIDDLWWSLTGHDALAEVLFKLVEAADATVPEMPDQLPPWMVPPADAEALSGEAQAS